MKRVKTGTLIKTLRIKSTTYHVTQANITNKFMTRRSILTSLIRSSSERYPSIIPLQRQLHKFKSFKPNLNLVTEADKYRIAKYVFANKHPYAYINRIEVFLIFLLAAPLGAAYYSQKFYDQFNSILVQCIKSISPYPDSLSTNREFIYKSIPYLPDVQITRTQTSSEIALQRFQAWLIDVGLISIAFFCLVRLHRQAYLFSGSKASKPVFLSPKNRFMWLFYSLYCIKDIVLAPWGHQSLGKYFMEVELISNNKNFDQEIPMLFWKNAWPVAAWIWSFTPIYLISLFSNKWGSVALPFGLTFFRLPIIGAAAVGGAMAYFGANGVTWWDTKTGIEGTIMTQHYSKVSEIMDKLGVQVQLGQASSPPKPSYDQVLEKKEQLEQQMPKLQ